MLYLAMGINCGEIKNILLLICSTIMAKEAAVICGHRRQLLALRKIAERGMPIHAFLFYGPEGVGKRTVAMHFLAGLFCKAKEEQGGFRPACLSCTNCIQVGEFRYPDFHFISDRENEGIGIAEIRALKKRLALTSWDGSWRGVLIDNAERLTPEAQSALLKILEEPSQGILFFLVTFEPHLLLETIRSRASPISFGTVDDEELASWLKSHFPNIDSAEPILRFAAGRPGLLKRFAEDGELFAAHRKKAAKTNTMLDAALLDQFRFADNILEEGPEAQREFIAELLSTTRRALLKNPDEAPTLVAKLKTLLDLHFELTASSANRRMLIDSAFLAFKEI